MGERRQVAERDGPFRWSSVGAPERVQYLNNALYAAGFLIEREADFGRAQLRPAAADEFHLVLVGEVLDALAHERAEDAQFVQEMRNIWGIAHRD